MLTYLSEADVKKHLTLQECIDALEKGFASLADGRGEVVARRRLSVPKGMFHWMPASLEGAGVVGAKLYTTFGDQRHSYLSIFDAHSGELVAVIQSYYLSQMRTAAATAVATRRLARQDARTACVIGTGSQALMQLQGVAAVRNVAEVRVFGRRPEPRFALARRISEEMGIRAIPSESAEEAVRGADLIVTATDAATPILSADWLSPGAHLNVIGSNFRSKREVGADVLLRAERVVVDSIVSAREEAGDIVLAVDEGRYSWERVDELSEVVAGSKPGRITAAGITVFKSVGVAIEDLATASALLARITDWKPTAA
jgi:alanine dehydrogenase